MQRRTKIIIIACVPLIIILNLILRKFPKFVEIVYSNFINKTMIQIVSRTTGIFPISIAEFLVIGLFIALFILIVILFIKIKKGGFLDQLLTIFTYLSVLYLLFMIMWGFNYNRLDFKQIANLPNEKATKEDLIGLCEELIYKANTLREQVQEDANGVATLSNGYRDVFERANKGYKEASKVYPELSGIYGRPKPILLSNKLSYTGITGIYIPYTGEANVNVNIPVYKIPSTAAHEMAHQRGFAREDEANYIAYLTTSMHPDIDFKYSGTMLALAYSMNTLYDVDYDTYKVLRSKYSDGVIRDLRYSYEFWLEYEGEVKEIAKEVNDTYLKSNGQEEGTLSYGRMVELLLAEYIQNNN
ncbi:MAG: DUF3810 domain-containing protein [Eubacteriales bacterium]